MHIAPGLYGSNRNCGQVVDSNWPDWTQSPIGVSGLSLPNFRVQREGSVVAVRALAKEAARPSLDDVERLSKGKPSKAKIGSRAVPHRLTLAERKAYDISKKKRFLVMRTNTRSYPLANTWRNYCEASGTPYIKIEQGSVAQSDTFYVDFSPMQEDPSKLEGLRQACLAEAARIIRASEGGLASDSESDGSASESEHESEELKALSDANLETLEANEYDQVSEGGYAFRLVCGRQETKAIAKAVLELASKKS